MTAFMVLWLVVAEPSCSVLVSQELANASLGPAVPGPQRHSIHKVCWWWSGLLSFAVQNLANTAWALAALISKKQRVCGRVS
jgi:hypothetical protein